MGWRTPWVLKNMLVYPVLQCLECGGAFASEQEKRGHACQRHLPCPRCGEVVQARVMDRHLRRCRERKPPAEVPLPPRPTLTEKPSPATVCLSRVSPII